MQFDLQDILAIAQAVATFFGLVGGAWWLRRFIIRTDNSLRDFGFAITELQIEVKSNEKARAYRDGQFDQIGKALQRTNESLGNTKASFERLWGFLEAEHGSKLPKRISDGNGS